MPRDLLYEIGVEEIPAGVVLPALEQLKNGLSDGLSRLNLTFDEIITYGTPRRLTIIVSGVADSQPDQELELKGPPADKAFDAEGKPTKAAEGFASKAGVAVSDLQIMETDKGNWIYVNVKETGQPAEVVLPELLLTLTSNLSFPKTMRWADLDMRFARPVRWLVALLGETVLDVTFANVKADNLTRGHRILGSSAIPVTVDSYIKALRENFVLADINERREAIRASAINAATAVNGTARIDEDLLTEIAFLVEWPTCLWGRFDPDFMQLPEPVIVTVMQKHQRYFPVEDVNRKLMPFFIAVRNGTDEGLETVRAGNEKVIAPRLEDAQFYLVEDQKKTLADRVEDLARVTFMEGMGTLADKTMRLEQLVAWLADNLTSYAAVKADAVRAAHLSKTDLLTLMVGDSKLGELQGVIGGEYAGRQGENETVAAAIAQQYRPRGAGDNVPTTPAGICLAIADKMDNLAACFRLGAIPSGSTDPFALRRQAQGVVEIILAHNLHFNLKTLVEMAVNMMPEPQLQKKKDIERVLASEAAIDAMMQFFAGRLDYILTRDGVAYDTARAVLSAPWTDIEEVCARARFLQVLRSENPAQFEKLTTAAERPARISRPENLSADVVAEAALFTEARETELWQVAQTAEAGLANALGATADYATAVDALLCLAEPIHQFFTDVMVMVDDETVRCNRLALLAGVDRLYLRLADFLEIVRDGG